MNARVKTTEHLVGVFAAMATAPPPENVALLVRHLKCDESIKLTRAVADAIPQHRERNSQSLPPPTELLPPLA